jgi:arylformamidase
MTGWRSWPRHVLEREYSPSSKVPGGHRPFSVAYRERSLAALASLHVRRDLAYGSGPDETLDLFPAPPQADSRPSPLVVFLHGGYWQELSKLDASFAAPGLVASGIALAAVDYTLAPAASLEAIIDQATRAVGWLTANAASLGVDPARIVVAGHSAGAHLAAKAAERLPPRSIAGLVLIGGVFDLRPIAHTSINDPLGLDDAEAARLSVTPRAGLPPAVVIWGIDETDEFRRQSRELTAAWREAGDEILGIEVDARHHFDLPLELGDPSTILGSVTSALAREGRIPEWSRGVADSAR